MLRVSRIAAALVVAMCIVTGTATTPQASNGRRLSANLVFWDQDRGFDAIVANADLFSDVSPYWYRVDADGSVVPYVTAYGNSYEDPSILSFLRDNGIRVIPTVANCLDGVWDGALVSRILADPQLAAANIASLVNLAVTNGYDGIDLDYENLAASDRAAFTAFVRTLSDALHARGKVLVVNVYAKTAEPGTWDGPMAQDWFAIGQAADDVRIMGYEYHWSTSGPGPIAPIAWLDDVLAFARTTVPAAKITAAFHLYGYDWGGKTGTPVVWDDVTQLASRYGAAVQWDSASAEAWLQYVAAGAQHTVWFGESRSVDTRLQLAEAYGVTAINLWRLGGEDPSVWPTIRARVQGTPSGDTVAPQILLISPMENATLTPKQRIEAQAWDNVAVARVEFFVDGSLLATDTAAPYVISWNTRKVKRGAHVITATAYDARGNSGTAQVTVYK